MNQDFMFALTPGRARALVRLAEICPMTIDDGIRAMAATGLLTAADFEKPVDADVQAAVQTLVDCDMRAVLPIVNRRLGTKVILTAAKVTETTPLLVISTEPTLWLMAAKQRRLGADCNQDAKPECLVVHPRTAMRDDVVEHYRAGLLVIDFKNLDYRDYGALGGLAREFARTIVFGDPHGTAARVRFSSDLFGNVSGKPWFTKDGVAAMAELLFPGSQTNLLINRVSTRKRMLEPFGYTETHPTDIAFLFNIVPQFIHVEAAEIDEVAEEPVNIQATIFAEILHAYESHSSYY